MRVLVTGATGFVGREVVRELHRAKHEVHFLTRRAESPGVREVEWSSSARVHFGDVLDTTSVRAACAGMDAILHLVGIISETGTQTFENIHTRGTENMVAAAQSMGVRRLIHMSALGTRENAASRYHRSKWAAEELVRQSGRDWTIFRPSIIHGPGDGFVNLFAKIARLSPVVPIFGNGKMKFQPVAVENVARAFVKALMEPRSSGQTWDLCGAETLTLIEMVDSILRVTGRNRWKLRIPFSVARVQAVVLEFVCSKLLHKAPPLNRDQLLMLREDNTGNGKPADELFQLVNVPFQEGIARYLRR